MRVNLVFNPLPTRIKWVIEAGGRRIPTEFRGRRLSWTWPSGESYRAEFTDGGIAIDQDGRVRVRRFGPSTLGDVVIRRWECDGTPLLQRFTGCCIRFRVERGPLVPWVRSGFGPDHPLIYPAAWSDRLPLLCGMAMAALYNYD